MIRIRVPGTSANLGPGFDSLGLALNLYNWYEIEELGAGEPSRVEGCPVELSGEDNLFLVAYRRGLVALGLPPFPLRVKIDSRIPIARGLGSSAACIVGGLLAASHVAHKHLGKALDRQEILNLASGLEGHPDNVAPAILGGFRVSTWDGTRASSLGRPLGASSGLELYALVPPFSLETKVARAALPKEVGFADAVFNLGRASMVTASFMSGDWSCLSQALEDRLHQDRRAPLIPGYKDMVDGARQAGATGVYLSGAGPTIMVLARRDEAGAGGLPVSLKALAASRGDRPWTCLALCVDDLGATLEE